MFVRMNQAAFVPVPTTGPNDPVTFNRVINFEYTYQGTI
jgi:hypothetical protein